MITHQQWSIIHKLRKQGLGIRQIARHLHIARNTVRKSLERKTYEAVLHRSPRETMLTPFTSRLPELALQAGYNAKKVYEDILLQGYGGSYQQVARMIRPLRERMKSNGMFEATASPGQEGHVYWGTTLAWIGETTVRVNIFLMVLGHSGAFTGTFVLDETIPTFLKCHETAFCFLKVIPNQIIYDNPNKIVLQFDANGQPLKWHPKIRGFLEGYGVEPLTRNYYFSQTNGKIVRTLKQVKKVFLHGRQFENLKALNSQFERWRDHALHRHFMSDNPPSNGINDFVLSDSKNRALFRPLSTSMFKVP